MRILVVHNAYQQFGGEDSVFAAEVNLLQRTGYDVSTLLVSNEDIRGPATRIATALLAAYNPLGLRLTREAIARHRPDVVHVHNFFPRLSASVFDACLEAKIPVVWTLHNFRIACANGLLFRDGAPCELCLGASPIHGVLHRCYRGSIIGSVSVASMIGYHQLAGTWLRKVDRFITLTDFSREKIVAAGVPREKIVVKPNFIEDPRDIVPEQPVRTGALFVGRLSAEKGVATLVEAWHGLDIPLTVIGDGPEGTVLRRAASSNPQITFLGQRSRADVQQAMASAQVLIVPSRWFENFPMTVVEAFAAGTPVIASRIGALEEIVQDGENGCLFKSGDASELRHVVQHVFARLDTLVDMQRNARLSYENRLSSERNLIILSDIYCEVLCKIRAC